MDLGINGRIALVTGASRGLGFAAAKALGAEGCRVAIVGRDADRLQAAAAEIGAHPIVADVSDREAPQAIVQEVQRVLGPVDILVANAGGPQPGGFTAVSEDDWEAALQQNLMATVRLMSAVLPNMRARTWGRIVTITSRTVREVIDGLVLSNATRAGVAGAVRTLAREVAREGICVTNVMPGSFATERLVEIHGSAAAVTSRGEQSIMGRIGDPDEMGSLIAFLASERAAYITGASILIDGGESTIVA